MSNLVVEGCPFDELFVEIYTIEIVRVIKISVNLTAIPRKSQSNCSVESFVGDVSPPHLPPSLRPWLFPTDVELLTYWITVNNSDRDRCSSLDNASNPSLRPMNTPNTQTFTKF